tara:strand:+ start:34 stop:486 length:453 start_codon:yes stop_codon:yes gene_type:complete
MDMHTSPDYDYSSESDYESVSTYKTKSSNDYEEEEETYYGTEKEFSDEDDDYYYVEEYESKVAPTIKIDTSVPTINPWTKKHISETDSIPKPPEKVLSITEIIEIEKKELREKQLRKEKSKKKIAKFQFKPYNREDNGKKTSLLLGGKTI